MSVQPETSVEVTAWGSIVRACRSPRRRTRPARRGPSWNPGRMSPVSKGRKRKPGKGGRKTGARRERAGLFGSTPPEHGFDTAAYLGDLSPVAPRAEVEGAMDR